VDEYDYETDLECLVRYYWHVLDRGDNSEPSTQVIYDQVSDFEVELVVSLPALNGQDGPPELSSSDYWPPLTPEEGQRPVAIVVRTEMPAFGNIVRQWPIAHD
jgi:general secretion pathway protein J